MRTLNDQLYWYIKVYELVCICSWFTGKISEETSSIERKCQINIIVVVVSVLAGRYRYTARCRTMEYEHSLC